MADFEKVYSIKFDVVAAQRSIKRLKGNVKDVGTEGKRAARKLSTSFKEAASKIKSFGQTWNRYVTLPVVAAGGAATKFALDMNKSMANVSTLLSGNLADVVALKEGVQDLAIESGKSTTDLADGLYQVVSALGESSDNMNQLRVATKAAVAGVSDTSGAINLLTSVSKGYGDTSSKMQEHISDLAFKTVKLGVTTFPELAESMGKVVPLAAAMNTPLEELFGTMATLTGVTGNTSEVVTQLSSTYASFMKPSERMTKLAKEQGFASAAAMLKAKGFADTMKLLAEVTGGEADQVAKFIRRKEGQLAVLALAGGQADTYTAKLKEMENAVGATDEAYKKQTEGINKQGHSWERTKQRMVVFAQRLGDRLLPILERLFDRLEPIIKAIENMSDESVEAAIQFGKWAIQITIASKALGGLFSVVSALGSLSKLTGGINAASTAMGGLAKQSATSLGLLSKLGLVGAAAGAGLAVGSMVSDVIVQPHMKRKAREQDEKRDALKTAERARKFRSTEAYKEETLKELRRVEEKERADVGGLSGDALERSALARDYRRVRDQRRKLETALHAQRAESFMAEQGIGFQSSSRMPGPARVTERRQQFEGAIQAQRAESFRERSAPQPQAPPQPPAASPTTININASHLNAREVGREVQRQLRGRDAEVRRAAQSMGASEL